MWVDYCAFPGCTAVKTEWAVGDFCADHVQPKGEVMGKDTGPRFAAEMEHLAWLADGLESGAGGSQPPEMAAILRDARDAAWEHVKRLEWRIKEQRDHLEAIHRIHDEHGNSADRKRMAHLERVLGQKVAKMERHKAMFDAVVERMRRIEAERDNALAAIAALAEAMENPS